MTIPDRREQSPIKKMNRRLELLVKERTSELQKSMEELNALTYTIAHDLRAPLRTMVGMSDLIIAEYQGKVLDKDGCEMIARIAAAAARLDQLTQDLLSYHRLSVLERIHEPVNMDMVYDQTRTMLALAIQSTGATLERPSLLGNVNANCVLMQQALDNLVSNALKFVPRDRRPKVEVWSEAKEGMTRVCVRDNGIGVEPEYHEKVFKIFERLSQDAEHPGTGVGLAIVKRAVERCGGRVGLDSKLGEGSTFWFELPTCEEKP